MEKERRADKRTRQLYYEDAYMREFEAIVEACVPTENGFGIILNQTAFYPEGGGQPCDLGVLESTGKDGNGRTVVLDVEEKEGKIWHFCNERMEKGARVRGRIDWDRRLMHMREHSGEHIISGIICREHGYSNIGFHMGKDFITIDFSGLLTEEEIIFAQRAANAVVMEDVEILAEWPDDESLKKLDYRSKKELDGKVRIVTVPGADCCACCGTHVRRTGEIGPIQVIGSEHYKSGIRLTLLVGEKALADYVLKSESNRKISALLSVKPEETAQGVERLLAATEALKQEYGALKMQLLSQKVESVRDGEKSVVMFEKGLSSVDVRRLADSLQKKTAFAAVFCGDDEAGYRYVIIGKGMDMPEFGKNLNAALNGRGGGKNPMIQGSVPAVRSQIEAFLEEKGIF